MNPINVHEFPSDPSLVPAYRIAVMQAALEGKSIEWRCKKGHNPDNLTVERIGKGYRLLTAEEMKGLKQPGVEYWSVNRWMKPFCVGTAHDTLCTYRTKAKPGEYLPKPHWTDRLPKEYAERAKKNRAAEIASDGFYAKCEDRRPLDSFQWVKTPEDWEFWSRVDDYIVGVVNKLPPIPETAPAARKLVPWTQESMVWPDCVRRTNASTFFVYGVRLATSAGLLLGVNDSNCHGFDPARPVHSTISWAELYENFEYSVDHGKTWQRCGTEEEAP